MFAFDTHTSDFAAGSELSIRNYFWPSNGLSERMGCIRLALKSRDQGTSSLPCVRSAEYFLCPVTVHSTVSTSLSQKQRTHLRYLLRQMSYGSSSFTATAYRSETFLGSLSHTNNSPPPPILLYSLKYNIFFQKTLPWQLLS